MAGAIGILRTTLGTLRDVQDISAGNVARYGSNDPRQQANLSLESHNGVVSGLVLKGTSSFFDEQLAETMRVCQTKTGALQRRDETYSYLEQRMLGLPGQQASFFHSLSAMSSSFKTLAADGKSFPATLASIHKWMDDMSNAGNVVQDERRRANVDLSGAVQSVNDLLQQIADFNQRIRGAQDTERSTIINQRRSALHELSGYMGIRIIEGENSTIDVVSASQMQLVSGGQAGRFVASADTAPSAGSLYQPVGYYHVGSVSSPIDATSALTVSGGRMAELLNIRDAFLPGIQEQLDLIAYKTAAEFNKLHNLGTSMSAPNQLTGELLPGGVVVAGTTALAGAGVVRIGMLDRTTGNIATHVDIDLSGVSKVDDLLTEVNSKAGVSAAIENGVLVLKAGDASKGVVIGYADQSSRPHIGFDGGSDSADFSSFFGLNNLFVGVNSAPLAGFCQAMKVCSDIDASKGQKIAVAYAHYPSTGIWAVGSMTTSLASDLSELVQSTSVPFPSTVECPNSTKATIHNYMTLFLDRHIRQIQSVRENKDNAVSLLSSLSERASQISGVDIQQEFMLLQKHTQDAELVISALSVVNRLLDSVLDKL